MSRGSIIGFSGQTRVLVYMSQDPRFMGFEGFYEGEDFEFMLSYAECKELISHMSNILYLMEINHGIGKEDGKREMDTKDAHEERCASRRNGCRKGKENPSKEVSRSR